MAKKIALLGFSALLLQVLLLLKRQVTGLRLLQLMMAFFSKKGTFRNVKGDSSALFMYQTKIKSRVLQS